MRYVNDSFLTLGRGMRRVKLNLVLLALLLLATTTIGFAQPQTVLVTGRAVDERGAPISDAIVTLYYPPCHNCIDHILPVGFSLPDGVFFVDHTDISFTGLELFIEERVPKGFWSPLGAAPFDQLSHSNLFKGLPIRPRKGKGRVDLGDVLVRIRYGKVIVDLQKMLGDQYKTSEETLRFLKVTLRDGQGKIIYDGSLPAVAFDRTVSSLNLALTKGKWTLAVSLDNQNQRIRSPRLLIRVDNLGCMKVSLRDGKPRQQACD